ncbi:MAG: hypothetical protein LBJ94_00015 [Puniceicoccales bacterium]|jgi:hypothetical protein|nr:hypothetical protein [Puniceicoccales bacterium]
MEVELILAQILMSAKPLYVDFEAVMACSRPLITIVAVWGPLLSSARLNKSLTMLALSVMLKFYFLFKSSQEKLIAMRML